MALLLTQDDLRPLVEQRELFEGAFKAIEAAVLQHHRGQAGQAAFLRFALPGGGRMLGVYVTSSNNGSAVRVFPDAGSVKNPTDEHVMVLLDAASGTLLALLAGDDLNPLRTAVPAGVGARYLAAPNATTLCILGSGQQARAHAQTICQAVASIERVLVWSPTREHREAFAQETASAIGRDVRATETPQEAVEAAHVVTATGLLPFGAKALEPEWLRPGALMITMTGASISPGMPARLFVPTKSRPELLANPFRGGPPPGDIPMFELAEVMLGSLAARERPDQTLIFNLAAPYGWDIPIMGWAYEWAVQNRVGTTIRLTSASPGAFPSW